MFGSCFFKTNFYCKIQGEQEKHIWSSVLFILKKIEKKLNLEKKNSFERIPK